MSAAACDGGNFPPPGQGGADPTQTQTPPPAPTSTPAPDPNLLLPDMETLAPEQLYVQISPQTGVRELRFATTVINSGAGPLTMLGAYDPKSDRTNAYQLISTRQGTERSRFAGSFVFHEGHNHWHFEDFTQFELWTYEPDGGLDDLLASTGKLTFCIFDTVPVLDNATPDRAFPGCGNELQGISVGWGDTYEAFVPGQRIDLTGVPDGRYALRSTADPDNRLVESNDSNNSIVVYVAISWPVAESARRPLEAKLRALQQSPTGQTFPKPPLGEG